MSTHELKTWPEFFQAIVDGRKNFEVRFDDRGYQAGDQVVLIEWNNRKSWGQETGRRITAEIGYVLHQTVGRRPPDSLNGYVVFSLLNVEVSARWSS